ncbi:MAG: PilZ domain-containing protein [bacterium]
MLEKRKRKRASVAYYLEVFEGETKKLLGRLINITPEGLMLESREPIETSKAFQLSMNLPGSLFGNSKISLEARSIWCRKDSQLQHYKAGFQLQNLDTQVEKKIQRLIEKLK